MSPSSGPGDDDSDDGNAGVVLGEAGSSITTTSKHIPKANALLMGMKPPWSNGKHPPQSPTRRIVARAEILLLLQKGHEKVSRLPVQRSLILVDDLSL